MPMPLPSPITRKKICSSVSEGARPYWAALAVFLDPNQQSARSQLTPSELERRSFVRRLRGLGVPVLVLVIVAHGQSASFDPGPLQDEPNRFFVLEGGRIEEALKHLDGAIRLNPALRFQARNDSDFQNLAEDPRFTELLYPDPGSELAVSERT